MDSTRVTSITVQGPRLDDINVRIGYGHGCVQSDLVIGPIAIIVGGSNAGLLSEVIAEAEAMEAIARNALAVAEWLRSVRAPLSVVPAIA